MDWWLGVAEEDWMFGALLAGAPSCDLSDVQWRAGGIYAVEERPLAVKEMTYIPAGAYVSCCKA